jgi:hypothetical protein
MKAIIIVPLEARVQAAPSEQHDTIVTINKDVIVGPHAKPAQERQDEVL